MDPNLAKAESEEILLKPLFQTEKIFIDTLIAMFYSISEVWYEVHKPPVLWETTA